MAARSGGGGSTKIDRKTSQQTSTKPSYREEIEKDWRLILHDDTVHTIQQVNLFMLSFTTPQTLALTNLKMNVQYCSPSFFTVQLSPD